VPGHAANGLRSKLWNTSVDASCGTPTHRSHRFVMYWFAWEKYRIEDALASELKYAWFEESLDGRRANAAQTIPMGSHISARMWRAVERLFPRKHVIQLSFATSSVLWRACTGLLRLQLESERRSASQLVIAPERSSSRVGPLRARVARGRPIRPTGLLTHITASNQRVPICHRRQHHVAHDDAENVHCGIPAL
jgi:hypothetical protein